MEYADDFTYITTCKQLRILKKRELPPVLAKRGLVVNETKTEEYSISREGDDRWKRCKLLGSLLSTEEDIARRKALAVAAISSKSEIFYSNLDIPMKMRAFNVYVGSIFLYNSELWGLTKTQKDAIDAFHRRLLRTAVLNVKFRARCPTRNCTQQPMQHHGQRQLNYDLSVGLVILFASMNKLQLRLLYGMLKYQLSVQEGVLPQRGSRQ